MRSVQDVRELLDRLDEVEADALEAQDLDFKRWDGRSLSDMRRTLIDVAVCMAMAGAHVTFQPMNEREMRAGHFRAHFDPAEPIRASHRARRRSP